MARLTRQEAKEQTRQALLLAGLALFAERGLDEPSLDAICERAGYTRGAFYVHFADREAFVTAVMEEVLAAAIATIVQTAEPSHDLERTIVAFTDAFVDARAGRGSPFLTVGARNLHLLLDACRRDDALRVKLVATLHASMDQLADLARAGQAAGTVRHGIDCDQGGTLLVAVVLGTFALEALGAGRDLPGARDTVLGLLEPVDDDGAPR